MLGARSAPFPTQPNAHAAVKAPVGPDAHQAGPESPKATFARPKPAQAISRASAKLARGVHVVDCPPSADPTDPRFVGKGRARIGGSGGTKRSESPRLVLDRSSSATFSERDSQRSGDFGQLTLHFDQTSHAFIEERSLPYVPNSVHLCNSKRLTLATWETTDPAGTLVFTEGKCHSWRHPGGCSRHISQRDYSRLQAALKDCRTGSILFAVLTYDRERAPKDTETQYRELQPRWKRLEELLRRGFGKFEGVGKFEYASYVEAHRDGLPHVNVIIVSPKLARYYEDHPPTESDLNEEAGHGGKRAPHWFRDLASHAGWGSMVSLRPAETKDAVCSYVTKFDKGSVSHPTLEGEVTKLSQTPFVAPRGFRRTRSSKGFLPKLNAQKNESISGSMLPWKETRESYLERLRELEKLERNPPPSKSAPEEEFF